MTVDEIVGLCHSCHSFIHCGRLSMMLEKGNVSKDKFLGIMRHGFRVLKRNGLSPNASQANSYVAALVKLKMRVPEGLSDKAYAIASMEGGINFGMQRDWSKWHLVLDGEKYYSKFKDIDDWRKHYE